VDLPLDTDIRDIHQYYLVRPAELIKVINNKEPSLVQRDNICDFCKEKTLTTFHFPGGPPALLFFPVQGLEARIYGVEDLADKEETLPPSIKFHGFDYDEVAFTMHTAMLGPKYDQAAQHIVAVLFDGNEKLFYDGLRTRLEPHLKRF